LDDVIAHGDRVLTAIFANDYGVVLSPSDLLWLVSPQKSKLSLHVVVCTHGPQWVYSSNHQSDPSGASHLAQRIRQVDPSALGPLVDVSVYTKDREMRALGASKFGKPGSAFFLYDRGTGVSVPPKDTLITCLDCASVRKVLDVPLHIPRAMRVHSRGRVKTVPTPSELCELEPDDERTMVITRMLDLLRDGLHPSAFHDRRGSESPLDPSVGIKFGYGDRSEPCYTGHVHDGRQNLRCWIDPCGDVHAKCFSTSCASKASHRLGRLKTSSDADVWRSGAVTISSEYLDVEGAGPLRDCVDKWLRREVDGLAVRSPLGSGKSTALSAILSRVGSDPTVLVVTYRQSLAMEFVRKLETHGFVSYLDCVDGVPDLTDRKWSPRVICQVTFSLPREAR
jgi:hypothetical protein